MAPKWNKIPYTKESSLSPETFLHPHLVLEDVSLPDEIESFQEAAKFVIQAVSKLISEQLIRDGGLEGGKTDQIEIKPGEYIWTFRSEDNPEKGILFGKVIEKKGSNSV